MKRAEYPLTSREIEMVNSRWAGMPKGELMGVLSRLGLKDSGIIVYDVQCKGRCYEWKKIADVFLVNKTMVIDMDRFVQYLADKSLTHRIMHVIGDMSHETTMYLGRAEDGKTNIDADVLEAFVAAAGRD